MGNGGRSRPSAAAACATAAMRLRVGPRRHPHRRTAAPPPPPWACGWVLGGTRTAPNGLIPYGIRVGSASARSASSFLTIPPSAWKSPACKNAPVGLRARCFCSSATRRLRSGSSRGPLHATCDIGGIGRGLGKMPGAVNPAGKSEAAGSNAGGAGAAAVEGLGTHEDGGSRIGKHGRFGGGKNASEGSNITR